MSRAASRHPGIRGPASQDPGSQDPGSRFPGFDAEAQSRHWDPVTAGVVLARLGRPPDIRFFTPAEEAIATALCDRCSARTPAAVRPGRRDDRRPAGRGQETDGWRYADMPEDGQAWRDTLRYLDDDARAKFGDGFARVPAPASSAPSSRPSRTRRRASGTA